MLVLLPLLIRWFFFIDTTMKKNYVVYQHVTPDEMYYFGQTQNVERRWSKNGAGYRGTALYPYIEKYGWDNIQHIVLFRDQNKEDALWIENFLIETAQEDGFCINKNRSGNISKEEGYKREYYEDNKDKIKEQQKQYYEDNKDKKKQYQEQYYEQNKDKIKQYREQNKDKIKQYREKNHEKNREYQRQYRQRKKLEKQLKEVEITPLF